MPAGAQDAALLAAVRGAIREGALPTVAFTVGVLSTILKAFITGASPRLLPLYCSLQWPIVFGFVVRGWRRTRHLLYLAEFCWFANAVGWLAVSAEMLKAAGVMDLSLVDASARVSAARAFFVVANGPLAFAVVMNKNRLVFHDPVKTSGFFIHYSPALTSWAMTWRPDVGLEGTIVRALFGDAEFFGEPCRNRHLGSHHSRRVLSSPAGHLPWECKKRGMLTLHAYGR